MTKKVKSRDRKVNTMILLTAPETEFLDRKIDKKSDELKSRSAILRLLVHRAMVHPELLDVRIEK